MGRLAPGVLSSLLLIVAAAALGTHLLVSPPSLDEAPAVAAVPGPEPDPEPAAEDAFAIPGPGPLTRFAEITERPLFSPSRRPPVRARAATPKPVAAAAPTPKQIDTGEYRLLGVVIEEDRRVALLRSLRGRTIEVVSEGGTLEAWTVEKIEPESVTLVQGDVRDVVLLRDPDMTETDARALGKIMRRGGATDRRAVRPRAPSSTNTPKLPPRILTPGSERKQPGSQPAR